MTKRKKDICDCCHQEIDKKAGGGTTSIEQNLRRGLSVSLCFTKVEGDEAVDAYFCDPCLNSAALFLLSNHAEEPWEVQ